MTEIQSFRAAFQAGISGPDLEASQAAAVRATVAVVDEAVARATVSARSLVGTIASPEMLAEAGNSGHPADKRRFDAAAIVASETPAVLLATQIRHHADEARSATGSLVGRDRISDPARCLRLLDEIAADLTRLDALIAATDETAAACAVSLSPSI